MSGTRRTFRDAAADTRGRSVTVIGSGDTAMDLARNVIVDETDAAISLATSTLQASTNTKLDTLHTDLGAILGVEITPTPAAVTLIANTAKNLLAANANRVRVTVHNPLATALYIRKATLATSPASMAAGGYDFVIPSGSQWISDPKEWAGGINAICATAGDVNVSESV